WGGVRDRAILEVLYSSGLRVSELTGLDWTDVDVQAETVRVLGKGRKERIVPLGRPALRALAAYRQAGAARAWSVTSGPVFRNARGGRLTTRSVARTMERYVATSGTTTKATPHALRHTSRLISSAVAPICARSRSCSATRACRPLSATRT